jgi:hypothetical protein
LSCIDNNNDAAKVTKYYSVNVVGVATSGWKWRELFETKKMSLKNIYL